jgi:hypothetical protein
MALKKDGPGNRSHGAEAGNDQSSSAKIKPKHRAKAALRHPGPRPGGTGPRVQEQAAGDVTCPRYSPTAKGLGNE